MDWILSVLTRSDVVGLLKGAVNLKQNPADYPHEKCQIVVP